MIIYQWKTYMAPLCMPQRDFDLMQQHICNIVVNSEENTVPSICCYIHLRIVEKSTPVMRLCNYSLINAIVFLIKMLVECKY